MSGDLTGLCLYMGVELNKIFSKVQLFRGSCCTWRKQGWWKFGAVKGGSEGSNFVSKKCDITPPSPLCHTLSQKCLPPPPL